MAVEGNASVPSAPLRGSRSRKAGSPGPGVDAGLAGGFPPAVPGRKQKEGKKRIAEGYTPE